MGLRFFLLFGVVAAGLAGCANQAPWRAQRDDVVQVIAHRGASAYAPENTLAAFELAIGQGADWFELDCTLTKDGQVAVIHDDTVERTTGVEGEVTRMTMAQLRELDAGAWFAPEFAGEKLPTLGEALALAKGRCGVYVEVKSCDNDTPVFSRMGALAEGEKRLRRDMSKDWVSIIEQGQNRNLPLTLAVIDVVRQHGMEDEVVIQSFSPVVCFLVRHFAPGIRLEYLGSYDPERPELWDQYLDFGRFIEVDGFNVSHGSLTPERLAELKRKNKHVAVWTVDDPNEMARFARMGVDGIITNKPDVCLQVLGRR